MRCVLEDLRRALFSRSFLFALLATLASMALSFGTAVSGLSHFVSEGLPPDWLTLVQNASYGEFSALWLPALSALPFAAFPVMELRTKAVRMAVFRTGRTAYTTGKGIACSLSGIAVQAMAGFLLYGSLSALSVFKQGFGLPSDIAASLVFFTLSRVLCGGIWACMGAFFALLSRAGSAAYLAPVCICYTLVLLVSRFIPQHAWLSPAYWLMQPSFPGLLLLFIGCALLLTMYLRKQVVQHA